MMVLTCNLNYVFLVCTVHKGMPKLTSEVNSLLMLCQPTCISHMYCSSKMYL